MHKPGSSRVLEKVIVSKGFGEVGSEMMSQNQSGFHSL